MHYSYQKVKSYAQDKGVEWQDRFVEHFDAMAKAHGYSQTQIDIAVQNLIHVVSPQTYRFGERLKIGINFIRGKI